MEVFASSVFQGWVALTATFCRHFNAAALQADLPLETHSHSIINGTRDALSTSPAGSCSCPEA
jgi:hypothetical protein